MPPKHNYKAKSNKLLSPGYHLGYWVKPDTGEERVYINSNEIDDDYKVWLTDAKNIRIGRSYLTYVKYQGSFDILDVPDDIAARWKVDKSQSVPEMIAEAALQNRGMALDSRWEDIAVEAAIQAGKKRQDPANRVAALTQNSPTGRLDPNDYAAQPVGHQHMPPPPDADPGIHIGTDGTISRVLSIDGMERVETMEMAIDMMAKQITALRHEIDGLREAQNTTAESVRKSTPTYTVDGDLIPIHGDSRQIKGTD